MGEAGLSISADCLMIFAELVMMKRTPPMVNVGIPGTMITGIRLEMDQL